MGDHIPDYYSNVNHDLLDALPADAGLLLEIGCGSGRLGEEYKKRCPSSTYYGVELLPDVAASASGLLDLVMCGAVETLDLSFLAGKVDCLVYGDVLEHLVDPWTVLRRHRALLSPGGRVVACIPNVQHWEVIWQLLQGGWTYTDKGQLDRTHLRFFTRASIGAMFLEAGLAVDTMFGMVVNGAGCRQFLDRLRPAFASLGIDEGSFAQQVAVSQYVVTAYPVGPDPN